ncbi:unnamed protein product [Bursaphelenchus xylophilus]|uniref:(pine wood nematode) hypothetical protein n=1 Tax=Bursaphelenchus xylophilus TaxID=6326 RepID=A0A7I8XFZ9_BURXY|nr:unnamed protein product [Bursaphelenchus xylophilus]CAG9080046.1 unnamed protein product [Bursaphelenchus xylophilus]
MLVESGPIEEQCYFGVLKTLPLLCTPTGESEPCYRHSYYDEEAKQIVHKYTLSFMAKKVCYKLYSMYKGEKRFCAKDYDTLRACYPHHSMELL